MPTSRLRKSGTAAALAVSLVGGFEGYSSVAYRDAVGVPTICYGETKGVHLGMHKTRAQCNAMLVTRLNEFAAGVEKCINKPMSDKVEVAFTSLAYNIGEGGFCHSSVARNWNAGHKEAACADMNNFVKAKGRTLAGLVHRRSAESLLCKDGIFDSVGMLG